ncbi:hypothetical protein C9980_25345 [Vibrio mediterranei]|uniref:lipoprotein n=1 Tax=Vibrio mediterranei TaxID=689 RepID=UPI000D183E8A|nr:lipoprotein [Vibrio mediterranei]PTC02024.1 hypothetical protein C9980_25345 [Vibrio mediterranei]
MKQLIMIFSAAAILTGCQTTIEANQYTVLDPDVNFYSDAPIVVATFDENDLKSKFYVRSVIEAMKARGFTSVYSERELNQKNITPIGAAYISVKQEYDTYTYESADYGMVDSGYSTTTCSGYGYSATCNTTNQKTFGVTGSSTKTGTSIYTSFALHYYDLTTKEKVLFTLGSTFDKSCNTDFLYNFLIDETISRTDFTKPVDYKYSVKLPEGVSCK